MLTISKCAKICRLSAKDIEPLWAENFDKQQAAGVLSSFGHTIDWGADRMRDTIANIIKMDIDLGLKDHAKRNIDALRLFSEVYSNTIM